RAGYYGLVIEDGCHLVVSTLNTELLLVVDFGGRFVRLVQTMNTDPVRVRRVKSLDVQRRDRLDVFDLGSLFVLMNEVCEILIPSTVTAHLVHHSFNLGPELT